MAWRAGRGTRGITWRGTGVPAARCRPALWWAAWLVLLGTAVLTWAEPARAVDADVLLRGGTIYDGTGNEAMIGDVALEGEKIVAVGPFEPGKAQRVIECRGLVIAPGLIDLHTHSDRSVGQGQAAANLNYLRQGCTTVVTGNCGGGPVEIGATAVNHGMSEQDVREAMKMAWVATGSDGSARLPKSDETPHPRNFGTFPRKIGYYALDQGVLSSARAIRSCSGLPADILRLPERGYIRPGYYADLVVFDPKSFIDRATFDDPQQYATGVRYLFIAGHLALEDSQPSQKLFGRAIRHCSTVP